MWNWFNRDKTEAVDLYHKKLDSKAYRLFNSLFKTDYAAQSIKGNTELSIAVVGAGSFPGFAPLVSAIRDLNNDVTKLSFTLIDTDTYATKYFLQASKEIINQFNDIEISIHIENVEVSEYLRTHTNIFNIIYLEQPNLTLLGLILEKLGLRLTRHNTQMRQSIAYLNNAAHSKTIVLATFLHKQDMKTLRSLLEKRLQIPTRSQPASSDGTPYSSGLIGLIRKDHEINVETIANQIRRHDNIYIITLILSCVFSLLTTSWLKLVSVFITLILLFKHDYSRITASMRFILLGLQLVILLLTFL